PSPMRSASRMAHASPVPAQTIDGFDGATASAPIDCTGIESNTSVNVAPESSERHTPPDAAPRYQMRLLPGTPLTAEMRPPSAGPSIWKRNGSGGGVRGAAGRCWAASGAARTNNDSNESDERTTDVFARRIESVSEGECERVNSLKRLRIASGARQRRAAGARSIFGAMLLPFLAVFQLAAATPPRVYDGRLGQIRVATPKI